MTADTQGLRRRYPGSRPFTREHERLFFGRDEDIARLTTSINVERAIVLYGKSGLGKSSLLSAGVLPRLERDRGYLTVPLRFGGYTEGMLKHPLDIVDETLSGPSGQQSPLNEIEPENVSLWQHIKNLQLANQSRPTMLLVFDQFEELFTYPEGVDDFAEALAEALYNRMPKSFQRALRLATTNTSNLLTPEQWQLLERPADLKVLFSIRSDRMSLLDSLSPHIPSILQNCYELKPLARRQAQSAITEPAEKEGDFRSPAFTYQPQALAKMLDYLTQDNRKPIESFQLQILCGYVEENIVINRNDTFVEEADLGDLEKVYQDYYDRSLKKVGTEAEQRQARLFVEEGLIFEKEERRTSLYEGQIKSMFDISPALLLRLVDTHLIRAEPHGSGGYMYELSHDTLVAPILKAKARRLQEEQERKLYQELLLKKAKRTKKTIRALLVIAIVLATSSVFLFQYEEHEDPPIFWVLAVLTLFPVLISFLVFAPLSLLYELIAGESLLSKLRRRAQDPTKRKGILTRIGRWLS